MMAAGQPGRQPEAAGMLLPAACLESVRVAGAGRPANPTIRVMVCQSRCSVPASVHPKAHGHGHGHDGPGRVGRTVMVSTDQWTRRPPAARARLGPRSDPSRVFKFDALESESS